MSLVHRPTRGEDLGGEAAIQWLESLIDALSAQISNIVSGTGDMRNSDNLSFLTDFALARGYMDLYSTGETNTLLADAIASVIAGTAAVTSVNTLLGDVILDAVAVGADPVGSATAALVAAQSYADSIAAGFQPRAACRVATAAALATCTYANGTLGLGATLTATGNGALTVDGVTVNNGDRILVKDQASTFQNGIYTVTDKGSGGTPWIVTRATDADVSGEVPAGMVTFITAGTAPRLAGTFVQLTPGPLLIGTSAQVFDQTAAGASYTFTAPLVNTSGTIAPTFGTGSNTFAQGNDSRFTDARTPTAHKVSHQAGGTDELTLTTAQVTNLDSTLTGKLDASDNLLALGNKATSRTNLGVAYGATAGTVTEGNDSRLTDGRAPTGAAGGVIGGTYPNPSSFASAALNTIAALTTTTLGTTRLTGTRSTFSDANYTVLATDVHVEQTGTLTASRTVTLPAASAVPAGWRVTVANASATTPTLLILLTIQRAGSDTIVNEIDFANTTSIVMRSPLGSYDFVSDGTSKWLVVGHGSQKPLVFWQHAKKVAVPDGIWTPIPWNTLTNDYNAMSPGLQTLTTTVAVASNGVTLPTATINVASTSGFPSAGYIAITGPPGTNVDTIVGYTGTTGTTFTGCNTAASPIPRIAGISTGTLATSQVVTGANCRFTFHTPYLWSATACAAWDANDTGIRNIRWRDGDTLFIVSKGNDSFTTNTQAQMVTVTTQPGIALGQYNVIEVYQSSGAVLNTIVDGIAAPLLMAFQAAAG